MHTNQKAQDDKRSIFKNLESGLYVIATPIGNIEDITIRAIRTLSIVDIIICEDTRFTKKLLSMYDIKEKKLISYNEHNSKDKLPVIIKKFKEYNHMALVSDAGTPLISDPGYKLINEIKKNNIKIFSVPGPSAITAALSISGVSTDKFIFIGFLPKKKINRLNVINTYEPLNTTLIIFERASRLKALLSEIKPFFKKRTFVILREITKYHEEKIEGNFSDITNIINKLKVWKGEITLLINSSDTREIEKARDDDIIQHLKKNKPSKVAAILSKNTLESRKELYQRCLKLLSKK